MKFFSIRQLLVFIYFLMATTPFYADIRRDLELDAVFATINHTHSHHGEQALRNILANPTADLAILKGRQTVINHFIEDINLHTYMYRLLEAFNVQEKHFERAVQPASDIEKAALKDFYFSSSSLRSWNHNPAYLELGQIAHFGNLCSSMAQHALAFAIFTWGLEEEHVCATHPAKKTHDPSADNHQHDHVTTLVPNTDLYNKNEIAMLGISQNRELLTDKPHNHKQHEHKHHDETCGHNHAAQNVLIGAIKSLAQSKEFKYAFQIWHGVAQVQELYSIQAIVRNNMKCIKELQTQLMGVARGMNVLNHIHATLKDHPEITSQLKHYSGLENICTSTDISKKLNKLLTLLDTNTFKGNPSVFSRVGVILAAYKLTQEIGHELEPALSAIGEIDAYISCAQLFINSKTSPARYSFAQYNTTSNTPILHADNFWHPLITGDTVQLNSISLGLHDNVRNIVLTGPNACGKSTNLKALTLCAYLAQTITIVPAENYSQTVCKEIYSSIVVSDNIQENKSLFVAELADAEELLIRVEQLALGEFMIIALDELFKSTHHEKGQNIAYRLLENLYASPQVITLVSTHFEKLIGLAENNGNLCANYTVDNFRLKPGIGFPDNAFDIVGTQIKRGRLL